MDEIIGTVRVQIGGKIVPMELAEFNNMEIEKTYEILLHLVYYEVIKPINYQHYEFTEKFLQNHKIGDIKLLEVYN